MNVRKRFRQLISAPELVVLPGAYDGLSARIIEEQGYSAIIAGGYAAAGSLLGQPDTGQSNMRDLADHYTRICEAVAIPVYADADTGFGGVNNVRQTVRAFERAGVAGLFFTDQVFPSRCGYLPGKQVISIEQMLAKINAALDARQDAELVICARTDVASIEGEDAAIERCQRFIDAGVDMAKPQGIDSIEGIKRVLEMLTGRTSRPFPKPPAKSTNSGGACRNRRGCGDISLYCPLRSRPSCTPGSGHFEKGWFAERGARALDAVGQILRTRTSPYATRPRRTVRR